MEEGGLDGTGRGGYGGAVVAVWYRGLHFVRTFRAGGEERGIDSDGAGHGVNLEDGGEGFSGRGFLEVDVNVYGADARA